MQLDDFLDKVIWGDAREVLRHIPARSVHLIVTSPPYNTGIPYDSYDDRQPQEVYWQAMREVFRECYRVLVSGGRCAVNLPACIMQHAGSRVAYLAVDFLLLLRKVGFLDREIITWVKSSNGLPSGKSTSWGSWRSPSNPALRDASEWILIMHKETPELKSNGQKPDITRDEFLQWTTNVWLMQPETSRRRFHPAPFPIELPYRLIKLYTYPEQVVLDPFCGIGTTCIVAKRLKRHYIGIDISRRYCWTARLLLSQRQLFLGG